MNRVMYREWFPQIVYNHHQTGPAGHGAVLPAVPRSVQLQHRSAGGQRHRRGRRGDDAAVPRRGQARARRSAPGARYSTWWNGGLRTTVLLPQHDRPAHRDDRQSDADADPLHARQAVAARPIYLAPIAPQTWHFRQSVDYSVTANKAVLDYASRHREQLLYNIWLMGSNAIERGNRDHWTMTPKMVRRPTADAARRRAGAAQAGRRARDEASRRHDFKRLFRDPAQARPARLHHSRQSARFPRPRPSSSTRCSAPASRCIAPRPTSRSRGKKYPAGSYVVKTAQAFRPHVLDMFEPQDHPNDFAYPGGPPTPPYDMAGWTLAYQMGVQFDRVLDGFDGPFEERRGRVQRRRRRSVVDAEGAVGFFLSHATRTMRFGAVNRLLAAGEEVRRLQGAVHGAGQRPIRPARSSSRRKATTLPRWKRIAAELGTPLRGQPARRPARRRRCQAAADRPVGPLRRVDRVRVDRSCARVQAAASLASSAAATQPTPCSRPTSFAPTSTAARSTVTPSTGAAWICAP